MASLLRQQKHRAHAAANLNYERWLDLLWIRLREWKDKVNVCAKGQQETVNIYSGVIWFHQNVLVRNCQFYPRKTIFYSSETWFALKCGRNVWAKWLTLSPLSPLVPAGPWNIKAWRRINIWLAYSEMVMLVSLFLFCKMSHYAPSLYAHCFFNTDPTAAITKYIYTVV